MAFIRRSGIQPWLEVPRRHVEAGRRLRVLTTFTGSTEARALDGLANLGSTMKVSYDLGIARLHAKAWLFLASSRTERNWGRCFTSTENGAPKFGPSGKRGGSASLAGSSMGAPFPPPVVEDHSIVPRGRRGRSRLASSSGAAANYLGGHR